MCMCVSLEPAKFRAGARRGFGRVYVDYYLVEPLTKGVE